MEEKFIKQFNKIYKPATDYVVPDFDESKLKEVIINEYYKILDNFTFKLYLLKFNDHTFIDHDENYNMVKKEIPLSYQVSLSVILTTDQTYTINNITLIKVGNIDKANNEFAGIKNIIDSNSLENLLNMFVFKT